MRVGIIDADLIGRERHRFPNLACEKLSGYWKSRGGSDVRLVLTYDNLDQYDIVYVSKVFTDTPVPEWLKETDRIHLGGTGFFFDRAPALPAEIEHQMPDYHLYDTWVDQQTELTYSRQILQRGHADKAAIRRKYSGYTDYSIGFLTRGCFRKCGFCVNQKYNAVFRHSPLEEFHDRQRPKICLLDDNFLGCGQWRPLLEELIETGKPFTFKQGLDERLLTDEKCKLLFSARYDGDFTFAFDNVADYDMVHSQLRLLRQYTDRENIKFYVLCGYEGTDGNDIEGTLRRIALLMRYHTLPYIMRYQDRNEAPWKKSEFRGMYVTLARWCNQPNIFKKLSFREFCEANQERQLRKDRHCSAMQSMLDYESRYPDAARKYFDLRYKDYE